MQLSERELILREGKKIAQALGAMLSPLVEIVLHDLSNPEHSTIAIENNLSGRSVGDKVTEIGLARSINPDFPDILQNYPNQFPDGRPAKSTSIGLKDSSGQYVAALCLNMDISLIKSASAALQNFIAVDAPAPISETFVRLRFQDIESLIDRAATAHNTTPRGLNIEQRQGIVAHLVRAGILDLKNGLTEVSRIFGVARSTVYTYLPKERSE